MTRNQRRTNTLLRPRVPLVDMQVGAANGSDFHLHENVVWTDLGKRNLAHLRSRRRLRLYDGLHGFRHSKTSPLAHTRIANADKTFQCITRTQPARRSKSAARLLLCNFESSVIYRGPWLAHLSRSTRRQLERPAAGFSSSPALSP